ncbi:AraC family transcriptional regulator [Gloeocapsopsis sp. IPPAS B-1203]|uniref:AraC family transcriptional regulator n=1 Tax=Gloeocapsopsis sp. IPPAS B-1203 TaxID=2049454 RepID=UPI000C180C03|nr:AraC family transcriptional regulator [Gloeocapsopsis sp. IPPAS B-1203]PIG91089.1 AraC family transcriptional regulator [Gloeocapsopsis sp. IPPAS B-1203]
MTLILNKFDWDELLWQTLTTHSDNLVLDEFEELVEVPKQIGQGYCRMLELLPGMWLDLWEREFNQDLIVKTPVHEHLIQISILLSGFVYCDGVHPDLGGMRSYFSGSGISPAYTERCRGQERSLIINVEVEPELLNSFFCNNKQQSCDSWKQLFRGDDWKVAFYPTVTPAMRAIAQQLWNSPYRGEARRLYLHSKVLELLAMHLNLIGEDQHHLTDWQLKPSTIDCIYYARDILLTNLEHPPSVIELAQQVGVSDRTLQRGFRELFGKTVFGYLTDQRMALAEQWLRHGNITITEVAMITGYSNPGHFTAAFKRKFGITPRECILGKKSVLRSSKSVLE